MQRSSWRREPKRACPARGKVDLSYTFDFSFLPEYSGVFLRAAWVTLWITAVSIALGFVIGTIGSLLRVYGAWPLRFLVGLYVELIRNTPLLVQIFIIYFGIATLGYRLTPTVSAVLALTINVGAYTTEIMRAGVASIARGQLEAADVIGLNRLQTIWHVVLMPAVEKVYPALSSQFILLMLASSITSQISVDELTGIANNVQAATFRSFETYIVVAVIYLALSFIYRGAFGLIGLALFVRRRRIRVGRA